nr:MAG TPA: hypothetical protein [Caudoviricetes sp.]
MVWYTFWTSLSIFILFIFSKLYYIYSFFGSLLVHFYIRSFFTLPFTA